MFVRLCSGATRKAGYIRGLPSWLTLCFPGSTRAEQRAERWGWGLRGRSREAEGQAGAFGSNSDEGRDLISPLERLLRTGGGGGGAAGLETGLAATVPAGGQTP